MVEIVCRYFFRRWEFWMYTQGSVWKKASLLGRSGVKMLIRGVMAVMLVVRNHGKFTSIVFLLFLYHFVPFSLSLQGTSKVASELRIYSLIVVRCVIVSLLFFNFYSFDCIENFVTCSLWNVVFIVKTVLLYTKTSSRKVMLKLKFETERNLIFMLRYLFAHIERLHSLSVQ